MRRQVQYHAINKVQPESRRMKPLRSVRWSLLFALVAVIGCSSRPARVEQPKYDAQAIGASAVDSMDRNGDQLLDAQELAASPALLAGLKGLDNDGDERLSAAEIAARIDVWTQDGVGGVASTCVVRRNGTTVPNVQVRFIPETFLGDVVKPADGVTDASGAAMLTAEGQKLHGVMNCGFYRVELSLPKDGKETIPEKFNTRTILGAEVRPKMEVNFEYDLAK